MAQASALLSQLRAARNGRGFAEVTAADLPAALHLVALCQRAIHAASPTGNAAACASKVGALVNERDGSGCSLLVAAARIGHARCVAELLELGAVLTPAPATAASPAPAIAGPSDGALALCAAARVGSVELIRILCEHGVSPDCLDADGLTPLNDPAWTTTLDVSPVNVPRRWEAVDA